MSMVSNVCGGAFNGLAVGGIACLCLPHIGVGYMILRTAREISRALADGHNSGGSHNKVAQSVNGSVYDGLA